MGRCRGEPQRRAHVACTGWAHRWPFPSSADDRPGLDSAGRVLLPRPVEHPRLRGGGRCTGGLCSGVSNSPCCSVTFPPSFLRPWPIGGHLLGPPEKRSCQVVPGSIPQWALQSSCGPLSFSSRALSEGGVGRATREQSGAWSIFLGEEEAWAGAHLCGQGLPGLREGPGLADVLFPCLILSNKGAARRKCTESRAEVSLGKFSAPEQGDPRAVLPCLTPAGKPFPAFLHSIQP